MTDTDTDTEPWYQPPHHIRSVGLVTNPETKIEAEAEAELWCQLPPSQISPQLLYRAVPNFGRVNVKWCRFCHQYQKHWSASGTV
jgi:hypothetical protein